MEASLANPESPAPTVAVVEPSVPTHDLYMEHSHPVPLLAITQGSHLLKQLLSPFLL